MIDSGRLRRSIWLAVQPVAPGRYLVHGGLNDHLVEVDGGRVTCHCPDAARMGDGCKHSLALRLRAGDGEVIDALRGLVRRPDGRSTKRSQAESSNPGSTGPHSRQPAPHVEPGATNARHRRAQVP